MKQEKIKQLLPAVMQRTVRDKNPMAAFLDVMEHLHSPSEAILAKIDAVFDPYRTADRFIPFLASWVNFDYVLGGLEDEDVLSSPLFAERMACLRNLLANASYLSQWRGTNKGLLTFLELATGVKGFEIKENVAGENGNIKPFHLTIMVPAEAMPLIDLIKRIVETEKPVYVTYKPEPIKTA